MRHAVIRSNAVENIVEWDGESGWTPPEGTTVEPVDETVGVGWLKDGESFAPPIPAPVVTRVYEPRPFANKFFTTQQQIELFSSTHPYVVYARGQLTLAKYVDLDDKELPPLLGSLVVAGMLTPERVQQILNNEGV